LRFVARCEPTDPEQVGFPSARQVASLTRLILRKDKTSKEKLEKISPKSRTKGKFNGRQAQMVA